MGSVAPRVRRLSATVHSAADSGTAVMDTDTRTGAVVIILRDNLTSLTFTDEANPGQEITLFIRQGVGAPWTWTAPTNMKFAGGDKGPTSTVQNYMDIYTMIFDGTNWNETARALAVR